ncbi:hypothetical protein BPODLACK_03421 [Gordonia sp. YY1]|uniref:Uncharacterized protein n=2 Tax=Gordonia TaxID=2053 RepID=A0ABQ0HPC8_GORRU|nr:hypothetical protein GCWB2_21080 [Gordonia rubripertincta]KAF0967962.1 hypothetical protein BPODLACK_03421 [Gordonia sp. YY1]GAB84127.1 hypothetical protein GORBP_032_00440 [Gordonia rubripertincta NBRC 101908]SDU79102.1 hypothetical protein SAMN04488548_136148 [Gordonia westfalica]
MASAGTSVVAGDPERLRRDPNDFGIEVGKQDAVAFEKAFVNHVVGCCTGPKKTWIVALAGVGRWQAHWLGSGHRADRVIPDLTDGLVTGFGNEANLGRTDLIRHFAIVPHDSPMRTMTRL